MQTVLQVIKLLQTLIQVIKGNCKMEKGTIYKFLAITLLILSIALLLYEMFPLIHGDVTEDKVLNGLKIPSVLFVIHLVMKAMIPGQYPFISDVLQQLNGMPIILLVLSLIILFVYIKTEKAEYYDVFKYIFGSFIGSFIQKSTSKIQSGDK